jgi:hypothetical protein
MRKITIATGIGVAVAGIAVVGGVAMATPGASAPAAATHAHAAAAAAAVTVAAPEQAASALVRKLYGETAKTYHTITDPDGVDTVLLHGASGKFDYAVLVNVKTGAAGASKRVPSGQLPTKF